MGGYALLYPRSSENQAASQPSAAAPALDYANQLISKLDDEGDLSKARYAIQLAEKKWVKDPFADNDLLLSDSPAAGSNPQPAEGIGAPVELSYTGYVAVGTMRLAIINKMEYKIGDRIEQTAFYVRRIKANQVEIGRQDTEDRVVLKLMEQDAIAGN
ncbi:hypothetical protein [Desulfosarcina ovata]|uniref:hypothetical protein n=1 Tax=Desulfosarcina ovata TaxID=83564 RepID=UPI0012D32EE9|nr:hypothetical protein [Desulfosarcina ovata]